MSLNVGGIYVRVLPRLTARRVTAAITAHYKARGAKPADVAPEPLSVDKTGQLAFAVLPASDGWICIADSERYHADFALANALADELETQVLWYTLYGATDGGVVRVLGKGRKPKLPDDTYGDVEEFVAERFPHPFTYFDQLDDPDTFGFSGVTGYDRGPIPEDEEAEPIVARRSTVDDPDTWPVRVPRELVEEGEVRVGHLVAFFLSSGFKNHAAATQNVFEQWLALVPKTALAWSRIGANASERKPFGSQTIGRAKQQFAAKAAAKHAYFEIGGPEQHVPQYYFELSGGANDDFAHTYGSANAITMYFPWHTPVDVLVGFANTVANTLDYVTGLVTPAVAFDNESSRAKGRAAAARLVARYAGLELQVDGFKLGDATHGAHWLVYLGPKLVEKIGNHGTPAGKGRCLRASERPDVGDLLAGPVPQGLRAMAALLEPIVAPGATSARAAAPLQAPQLDDSVGDNDALEAELRTLWQRRFYQDETRLRELARGFDRLAQAEAGNLELDVPYLTNKLAERLIVRLRELVEGSRLAEAEALLSRFSTTAVLGCLRYEDRLERLVGVHSPLVSWLIERADGPERARIIASLGATIVKASPDAAARVVAAMPVDADEWSWSVLLQPLNNLLGELYGDEKLEEAERVCDAIQPVARHNPEIYLWTATIFIARGRVDDAMTQIERMFEAGHRDWQRVRGDRDFEPLFDNPRFLALEH